MELYVLDDQMRRIAVVDAFESLIWTERFSDAGDFQLVVPSTPGMRNLLTEERWVTVNDSYRVGTIKNVESKLDADGRTMLTVSGLHIEDVMKDRVAKNAVDDLESDPYWLINDTPAGIVKTMFNAICIDGILDPGDIIPFIQEGELLSTIGSWSTLPNDLYWDDAEGVWEDAYSDYVPSGSGDSGVEITVSLKPQVLYDGIKTICDLYGLGFRLIRNRELSQLYFEVYAGYDRSIMQQDFDPVVFSIDMDNLSDSTEFRSITSAKNCAYVYSNHGALIVYASGVDPEVAGFQRRVLYVDATDVDLEASPELTDLLNQRGLAALVAAKPVIAFDGEISQFGPYKYGVDYDLGDVVTLKNSDGVSTKMRVTEQIFIQDAQGQRLYPTLVADDVIDPGSWYALPATLVWDDATGEWADA